MLGADRVREWTGRMPRFSAFAATAAGAINLFAWNLGPPAPAVDVPSRTPMRANGAFSFILLGLAVLASAANHAFDRRGSLFFSAMHASGCEKACP